MTRTYSCVLSISLVLCAVSPSTAAGQEFTVTSLGYRANQGGGGGISVGWTGGGLGNTWAEGEWVAYQLVLDNVQTDYPELAGFPDIEITYDFGRPSGNARFVDLVRGLQAGGLQLNDQQGWVMPDGQPFPVTTRAEIEAAQNGVTENVWQLGGDGDFQLLNLPDDQINRDLSGGPGDPTDERHEFIITKQDLLAAGIATTDNTIVIYYQLHESRTLIWNNSHQSAYDQAPTDAWGGYLYGDFPYDTDQRLGSGFVPGSSGHIHVVSPSGGFDIPLPIPAVVPGQIAGSKWLDENGNGILDEGEPTLSGWRVQISGEVETIPFCLSKLTDQAGGYTFSPGYSTASAWIMCEAQDREDPPETGWEQTYPNESSSPVGTGEPTPCWPAGGCDVDDPAAWGWEVALTLDNPSQDSLNFGNSPGPVTVHDEERPPVYWMKQSEPNPFYSVTHVSYVVPRRSAVQIAVYDVSGRRVRFLVQRELEPGSYRAAWNGRDDRGRPVPGGMYYVGMATPEYEMSRKVVVIR